MAQSPVITLVAGAVGALIGLIAPLINTTAARRGTRGQEQRELARQVMEVFAVAEPLDVILGGPHSAARRRLFVLAMQLDDAAAKRACENLIEVAGRPGATEDDIFPHWQTTVLEIGRVSRHGR